MFKIDESFLLLDVDVLNAEELIRVLCAKLEAAGCITSAYVHAVLAREEKYPTGLPTKPFCVALPHGEMEGVKESALAFARLNEPVVFRNMANRDESLEVKMVFLLANNEAKNQVTALRRLSDMFGEPGQLSHLEILKEPIEISRMLMDILSE